MGISKHFFPHDPAQEYHSLGGRATLSGYEERIFVAAFTVRHTGSPNLFYIDFNMLTGVTVILLNPVPG